MTTDLTPYQRRALVLISKHGRGNPIIGKNIAINIGLKDRDTGKEGADMRSVIHALRMKGYPICGTGEGYYYAGSQTELFQYIESLGGRIAKQQEALDALKKSFPNIARVFSDDPMDERPIMMLKNGDPMVWSVKGSEGRRHEVVRMHGFYTCTCESFKYSNKRTCKHTEAVEKEVKTTAEAKAAEAQKTLL